jgi:sulfite exporter TauE/SafE
MNILKSANEWIKGELFSTPFFVLFGIVFLLASLGFWQLGKTEFAKAYVIPTLVAGTLLVIIGLGLFFNNKSRQKIFPIEYQKDAAAFVESEIARTEATLKEYRNVVFTAIPVIIIICALIILFVDKSIWRASAITAIAMLTIILLIDGTASARVQDYNGKLISIQEK